MELSKAVPQSIFCSATVLAWLEPAPITSTFNSSLDDPEIKTLSPKSGPKPETQNLKSHHKEFYDAGSAPAIRVGKDHFERLGCF